MKRKLKNFVLEIDYGLSKHSLVLVIISGCLIALGLVLIFDTTSADILDRSLSTSVYYAVIRQCIFVSIGILLAACIIRIGYKELIEMSPLLFGGILFLLALTLLPGIGQVSNGARRWIGIGPFTVQPSEFVKLILPLFYIFALRSYKNTDGYIAFLKFLSLVLTPLPLIFFEPDNGTVFILLIILCSLLFITRVRAIYWAVPVGLFLLVGIGFASKMQHVVDRIQIYLHPEMDLLGKGHQPYQAKIAAGSGKLFGLGPGQSLQKLNYLPEANNDYIGAILAEEFGFIGVFILLLLFIGLQIYGYMIAIKSTDEEGYYLATIMTFLIGFQAFLNLGIVSGLLPSTGTTLPFISQGGSSLIVNCMAVAMIVSVNMKEKQQSVVY